MKYRYSLVDDDSELIIGYCNKIKGLTGKIVEINNELYHKIVLVDFVFCNEFKEHIKEEKENFQGVVHINILDDNMNIIAHFNFSNCTNTGYNEFFKLKSNTNFEMVGYMSEIATQNELKLWDEWISRFPKQKNEWVTLDRNGRRDWLRMLRVVHCCNYREIAENTNKVFHLDGTNITTYESFFIAFAEAMNGPGTYFGGCLDGFDDCLYGRFGVRTPFKLIWENSLIAAKNLDENEWKNRRAYLKKKWKKSLYDDSDDSTLNLNIFYHIIEILLSHNVEVVLVP